MKTHNFNRKHKLTKRKHKLTKRKHKGNKKTPVKRRITRRNRKHRQTGGDTTPSTSTPSTTSTPTTTSAPSTSTHLIDELNSKLANLKIDLASAKNDVENLNNKLNLDNINLQAKQAAGEDKQDAANNVTTTTELLTKAKGKVVELTGAIETVEKSIKDASNITDIPQETLKQVEDAKEKIKEKKAKFVQMTKETTGGLVGMVVSYIFDNFGTEKIKGVLNTMFDQIKLTPEEKGQIFTILDKKLNELQNSAQKQ